MAGLIGRQPLGWRETRTGSHINHCFCASARRVSAAIADGNYARSGTASYLARKSTDLRTPWPSCRTSA